MHLPMLFIKNKITRRQLTIKRAFPDAVDLLLICIETGMSIDAGFKRVAEEIRAQSKDLCKRSRCVALLGRHLHSPRMRSPIPRGRAKFAPKSSDIVLQNS